MNIVLIFYRAGTNRRSVAYTRRERRKKKLAAFAILRKFGECWFFTHCLPRWPEQAVRFRTHGVRMRSDL